MNFDEILHFVFYISMSFIPLIRYINTFPYAVIAICGYLEFVRA